MTSGRFSLRQLDRREPASAVTVIAASGEIDAANAPEFGQALDELAESGPLIIDLSGVAYLDSAGFEVLDQMLGRGAVTLVLSPDSVLRKAAALMKVPFHNDVPAARAAVQTV